MIFDYDCDLINNEDIDDCKMCYRYDICKDYFEKYPNEIRCFDDLKNERIRLNERSEQTI